MNPGGEPQPGESITAVGSGSRPAPLLIVDLDGVISPYGTSPHDGLRLARVGGHRLLYRPDVIDGLNALHRTGTAHLRWLTSWGNDARTHVAPALGLVDFPLLAALDQSASQGRWPKLEAIRRHVTPGGRFAWVDDDLTPAHQRETRRNYGTHCLLLRPAPTVGLTADELTRARSFLEDA
jgi:hypothetical protein